MQDIAETSAYAGAERVVIVYLWTAICRERTAPGGSLGISDTASKARAAAGQCLRDGRARLAFVEAASNVTEAHTFSPRYLPTGTGWWATPDPDGDVQWIAFAEPGVAVGLRALADSADRELDRGATSHSKTRLAAPSLECPAAGEQGGVNARSLPHDPCPPGSLPAAFLDVTDLDLVTDDDLAVRQSWLIRTVSATDSGATTAALALTAVTAELEARAQTRALNSHSLYWCGCGGWFTGLAAIEDHLHTFRDDNTHYEKATD